MLDTQIKIETPEGIELGVRIAGPVVRGFAYFIDSLIKFVVYFALYFLVLFSYAGLSESSFNVLIGILLILMFFFEWFYSVFFEIFKDGATPGKKVMGIKVICDSGVPITWSSSLTRNIVRVVDMLPFFYFFPSCGVGLLFILFGKNFKRIGDIAAGTIVVHAKEKNNTHRIAEAEPLVPSQPLSLDDKKAIVMFSERLNSMSEPRAYELADILEILTDELGPKGVEKLNRYANWVVGEK